MNDKEESYNINYETVDFEHNVNIWRPFLPALHKCIKRLRNSITDFEFDSVLLTAQGVMTEEAMDICNVLNYFTFQPLLKKEPLVMHIKFYFKHTPSGRLAYRNIGLGVEMLREDSLTAQQLINNKMRVYFEGLANQVKEEQNKPLIQLLPGTII